MSDSLWPHGLYSPWNSPGQNTGVGSLSLLQGIFPTKGSNPGLLHCRWILLPTEPQGKPKNTGVDSLSLLQWIFLTQESNQGLLHCRRILDQLSYEGSPKRLINNCNTNLPMDWYVALQFHYRFLLFAIPLLQKYSLTWTVLIKWKLYIKLQRNITSNFGKEVEKN